MVALSSSSKLWAFTLAEQLNKHHLLDDFYTTYSYGKNTFLRRFVKRIDREIIPLDKIHTNTLLAVPVKAFPSRAHQWNNWFDHWVARQLKSNTSKVFIGWSGMSLQSIRSAKKKGMKTIVTRGSSHILYQDEILREEYKRNGVDFSIHPSVIERELKEYEEADYISIPSDFVKRSFIEKGVSSSKLLLNPFGTSSFFSYDPAKEAERKNKFTIVYLGTLSIRKGLVYLFEALQQLSIPEEAFEVWFIGSIEEKLNPQIEKYKKDNWKFFGHINHYELQGYLSQCDVGVHPSVEEGLSMVIPQMMSCGVPVILTPNTGGENIVTDGKNGYVVPIRDPGAIKAKIEYLFSNREELEALKLAAAAVINQSFTWDDYGNRYNNDIIRVTAS